MYFLRLLHFENVFKHFSKSFSKNNFIIKNFFQTKNIYNGPINTYINNGLELKNEDVDKLINLVKESLKLNLLCYNYFSEEIAKQYLELAILEHKNLLLDDAKKHYFEYYNIIKKLYGPLNIMCANAETYIGVIYKDLGSLNESEKYLKLSLSNKKQIFKNDNYLLIDTLNNLGTLYQYKKKYEKSIEYFEHCIRILLSSEMQLNKDEQLALSYYNLSFCYIALNDLNSALNCLIRSQKVAENAFGPNHNLTNRIKNLYNKINENLNNINIETKKYEKKE